MSSKDTGPVLQQGQGTIVFACGNNEQEALALVLPSQMIKQRARPK